MLNFLKNNLKFTRLLLTVGMFTVSITPAVASIPDGIIGPDEYSWNTTPNPTEVGDGSGGVKWDIDYMGFSIDESRFSFGIKGGSILSGENTQGSQALWLGDLAIDVGGDGSVDYGIILGLNSDDTTAFDLYHVAEWSGVNKYNRTDDEHRTSTYKVEKAYDGNGNSVQVQDINGGYETGQGNGSFTAIENTAALGEIIGKYSKGDPGSASYVLEGSFDVGLLSLFDEETGGDVIMYLTMSCVNDEASVSADVSPVTATPVPTAFWLFGTALLGFVGISRRTNVS
jgi:hypothetical protein